MYIFFLRSMVPRGGTTGSAFAFTADRRFLAKSLAVDRGENAPRDAPSCAAGQRSVGRGVGGGGAA